MKAILFSRTPGTLLAVPPMIELVPDSALTISGMPVFLPDIPGSWSARVGLAFRIGRLGKKIDRKFAERYIDAVTLAVQTIPDSLCALLSESGISSAITCSFDGALTLGRWQPYSPADSYTVSFGDISQTIQAPDLQLEEAIEAVSALMTLKSGDVIVPAMLGPALPAEKEMTAPVSLDGEELLSFRIK